MEKKTFQWSFLLLEIAWLGISSCNLTWPFHISCQVFILDSVNEQLGVVQRMSRARIPLFLMVCVCAAWGSATDIWISVAVFILHYLRISYRYLIFLLQSLSCITFRFNVYGWGDHLLERDYCLLQYWNYSQVPDGCLDHVLTLICIPQVLDVIFF